MVEETVFFVSNIVYACAWNSKSCFHKWMYRRQQFNVREKRELKGREASEKIRTWNQANCAKNKFSNGLSLYAVLGNHIGMCTPYTSYYILQSSEPLTQIFEDYEFPCCVCEVWQFKFITTSHKQYERVWACHAVLTYTSTKYQRLGRKYAILLNAS